jgi:hypothetical protein
MLAQAMFQFEGGQGSLVSTPMCRSARKIILCWWHTRHLAFERPHIWASKINTHTVQAKPRRNWKATVSDGFHGTMAELLCAIEENREPRNSGRENLNSLAFCFAAIAAAHDGVAKVPGEVRSLPKGSVPATMSGSR